MEEILEKILKTIEDEDFEEVIPPLAFALAVIGREAGAEQTILLDYFKKVMNAAYKSGDEPTMQ